MYDESVVPGLGLINQMPVPPIDMVMPQLPNLIFTIANFIILGIATVILLRACKKWQTPLPIIFLLGGILGYVTEPMYDLLVCAWYPVHGQTTLVRAFNTSVPAWVIGPWGFYIGGQAYWIYRKIETGMTKKYLWTLFPIFWVTNVAFEIPGLLLGVYTYYGPQAFKIGGFPLWMGVSNASMPIAIGAAIYSLRHILTRWRVWLALPLVPTAGLAAGGFVGGPMWWTLHIGAGVWASYLATFVVIGCGCMLVYFISEKFCVDAVEEPSLQSATAAA